jgi:predicted amidophosphoribosyltransferase
MKGSVPIPCDLNERDGKTLYYLCPRCAGSLRLLGRKQNYCYECGEKLNWEYSPEHASDETAQKYWDIEKSWKCGEIRYLQVIEKQKELMYEIYKESRAKEKCSGKDN